jgi:hypothetical protein
MAMKIEEQENLRDEQAVEAAEAVVAAVVPERKADGYDWSARAKHLNIGLKRENLQPGRCLVNRRSHCWAVPQQRLNQRRLANAVVAQHNHLEAHHLFRRCLAQTETIKEINVANLQCFRFGKVFKVRYNSLSTMRKNIFRRLRQRIVVGPEHLNKENPVKKFRQKFLQGTHLQRRQPVHGKRQRNETVVAHKQALQLLQLANGIRKHSEPGAAAAQNPQI